MNKKYPFQNLKQAEVEKGFNRDLLEIFEKLEYTIISVLIDKLEHQNKYQTWKYDPYHYCMEIIIERFYFFLQNNNAVGDVMFESRGGKEDMRLKKSFSKIWDSGTHFIDSDGLQKILTSKQLKIQPKKLNISGLQVADLLAHPARRMMFRIKKIDEGKKFVFGEQIIEIIKNKYYRAENSFYGYGIKFLP